LVPVVPVARVLLAGRSSGAFGSRPERAGIMRGESQDPGQVKLHQIKIEFDAEQDRLRMRVSTVTGQEALLWLTRRCVLRLWPLLVGGAEASPQVATRAADPEVKKALLEFQHEKAISQAQFGKQYEEVPRTRPLGDDPLLIARLQRRTDPDGRVVLGLLPHEGQGIFLTLDEQLLHGFIKLLQQGVERAEWGFKLDLPWGGGHAPSGDAERTLQ
jgi:hypothetical protein